VKLLADKTSNNGQTLGITHAPGGGNKVAYCTIVQRCYYHPAFSAADLICWLA